MSFKITHHDLGLTVKPFKPELVGSWEQWSDYYVLFHKGDPWNEFLWCSSCSSGSIDKFGPVGTIGEKEANEGQLDTGSPCPKCGSTLETFWSVSRVRSYIEESIEKEGFDGVVGFVSEKLLFWFWGYLKTPPELVGITEGPSFYIDVIASEPTTRKEFLYESAIYFLHWIQHATDRFGVKNLIMRTHKNAFHVTVLAYLMGFHSTEIPSQEDGDRFFWVRDTEKGTQLNAFNSVDNFPRFSESKRRYESSYV